MAIAREIRRRIRGVRSTGQIAKAMETVAASKMQRAQAQTLASRPYAEKAMFVLHSLARQVRPSGEPLHPLLVQRPVERVAVVLYTADRGLCGAFNSNMIRKAVEFTKNQDRPVSFITVGRKGRDFLMRYGFQVVAEFTGIPDRPTLLDVLPVAQVAIDDYLAGNWDTVYLAYTGFINTLVQRPTIARLLPLEPVWETQSPCLCRLYLRARPAHHPGPGAAALYRIADLPGDVGIHRQRAERPHGGHAQRPRGGHGPDCQPDLEIQQGPAGGHHHRVAGYCRWGRGVGQSHEQCRRIKTAQPLTRCGCWHRTAPQSRYSERATHF